MTAIKFLDRPVPSENNYLDPQAMVDAISEYINAEQGNFKLKSTKRYLQLVVESIEQAIHARENGNFYAVHSTQFPIELFWPLGIMPLYNEMYSTIVGIISNDNRPVLSICDDTGFPCHNCASRTFEGVAKIGAWPIPDFVVFSGSPCDPTPKGQEMAGKHMGVPSFSLDRPYNICTPQSVNYWLEEHHALIRFLERQTGRRMAYDYLQEVATLSYRATQVYMEINELRSAIPCPLPAEAAFAPMAVYQAWAGTQECVDFLEELRDELKERVATGVGAVPQENFRYTYAAGLPFFDSGITAEMEKRYGAVNVMDHLQWWREDGDWLIDPIDPVASIAYRGQFGIFDSLHNKATDYAQQVRLAASRCKADGVVFFNNGCRHAAGHHRVSKDTIERSLGLPFATINCDMQGRTFTTFNEVMDQFDVFFKSVGNSKRRHESTRRRGRAVTRTASR